jgi:RecG-like helicase
VRRVKRAGPRPRRGELLRRLLTPRRRSIEDLDREQLRAFASAQCDVIAIAAVEPRAQVRVAGEVSSVRIVPRAGAPSLEVTITDGSGYLTGVFWGRRHISGIRPGKRILFEGRAAPMGRTFRIVNPDYQLFA